MKNRRGARDTGPSATVRKLVLERSGGQCERCQRNAVHADVHHRKPRRMGGSVQPEINYPSNLVYLCRSCHEGVESHRVKALEEGWLVQAYANPAAVPVRLKDFGQVYLAKDGTYTVTDQGDTESHDQR